MITMDENENTRTSKPFSRVNWNDPSIPAGDSPPLPVWPLLASAIVWTAWVIFLAVIA